jgi:geranylgeranyl reductase family protein
VIIIGAGPAGALIGFVLAQRGLDVLILEKERFPRYKPCGGGLTPRAVRQLPFDFSSVVEDRATAAKIGFGGRIRFDRSFHEPIVTLMMRDRFDLFMIEQAQKAGAAFKAETAFEGLDGQAGDLRVETARGPFSARVIVGADGVNSPVARQLRLADGGRRMLAVESELDLRRPKVLASHRSRIALDFGLIPNGYGWVFPKKNHLSAGVLTVSEKKTSMKAALFAYLDAKGLGQDVEVKRLKGATIRYGYNTKSRFANSKGMVIGDAAGLADPITGEGIDAAFQQARMAADVIYEYFDGQISSIAEYDQRMRARFRAEMACAERMSAFFYRFPHLSRALLNMRGQFILEGFIRIAAGRNTYRQQFNWRTLAARFWRCPPQR